jgi:uncharacterized repeat protein (TIGR03847 family)
MSRRLFIFDLPDRFVPGTMGRPGQRTFFLQARKGRAVVSVGLEKAQVSALADRMNDLLTAVNELELTSDGTSADGTSADGTSADTSSPDAQPTAHDDQPLDEPIVEAFRVGAMALSWDPQAARVVIEAQPEDESGEYVEAADDDDEGPDLMRVRIGLGDAHAFVRRAQELIAAGRPPCPFCGEPLEPTGHFCLARNGQLN